ncbi:hypothetical protein SAMN05421788_106209 [Filimonas lacunae]|uniref:Uncharacterized protein n=1 Tax=Filimonas lacunae TaxID=477680 RepID=A0A173MF83_9BACT|nr:hypothetical protein [Filimonas lacunae]BAV06149.1 hypothetical protein FLA_2164 [Filimonas lacunae]SIT24910.1 hypothetical protein SAMN05421788_106209 [Filimonas lacunae]
MKKLLLPLAVFFLFSCKKETDYTTIPESIDVIEQIKSLKSYEDLNVMSSEQRRQILSYLDTCSYSSSKIISDKVNSLFSIGSKAKSIATLGAEEDGPPVLIGSGEDFSDWLEDMGPTSGWEHYKYRWTGLRSPAGYYQVMVNEDVWLINMGQTSTPPSRRYFIVALSHLGSGLTGGPEYYWQETGSNNSYTDYDAWLKTSGKVTYNLTGIYTTYEVNRIINFGTFYESGGNLYQ